MAGLDRQSRGVGAMLGLAVGDAIGWPALYHRSYQLPPWTWRIRRELDAEAESTGLIRPPVPFSLNQPSDPLHLGPTDDSEWAAFTAHWLVRAGGAPTESSLVEAWFALRNADLPIRGSLSIQAAMANLRRGLRPPASGHDNPHYFDDGACIRAVPIGIVHAGDPAGAAELAALEAAVTNSLDGLWGARAMAAAIAAACGGAALEAVIAAAVAELPPDSWIGRTVATALAIATPGTSALAALPLLSDGIVNHVYSYATAAPETVALALAIVRLTGGDLERGTMLAASVARTADSVPAVVGAISGALFGAEAVPSSWWDRCRTLQGICLPQLAGTDLVALATDLGTCGGR